MMTLPELPPLFMVFDVESIGLHGEGFAVGWVVVDRAGKVLQAATLSCPTTLCIGTNEDREWVTANVPPIEETHGLPVAMRADFWLCWLGWKAKGAVLVADCCWPVEARFLAQCVNDDPHARKWEGPYPLHDLASVMLALGRDPLATNERLPDELPAHHPLHDARQSARLLIEAFAYARSYAALAVQAERERCAKLCDDKIAYWSFHHLGPSVAADCAAAIRNQPEVET